MATRKTPTPDAEAKPKRARAVPVAADTVVPGSKTEQIEKAVADAGQVLALIPKTGLTITRDDGREIKYPSGTVKMPRLDAEHWFAKAMGVEVLADA